MPNAQMKVVAVFLAALLALTVGARDLRADDKQGELEKLKKELDAAKKRITELEENAAKLTALLEEQGKRLLQAERAEKLARLTAEEQAKKFEERLAKLVQERAKPPRKAPALPAEVRGEVTDIAGDLVTLSIGIDAGLAVGTVLEVYRFDEKRLLGTVKVTDKFNLYPKQSIAKFTPARNAPLKDLKPEELPRKGDAVRAVKEKD